ncbi:hypothetical protein LEQ41_03740 [Streptococcus agalactiae]|nr:hypothetical protein [Streptococcus agalactiae]
MRTFFQNIITIEMSNVVNYVLIIKIFHDSQRMLITSIFFTYNIFT